MYPRIQATECFRPLLFPDHIPSCSVPSRSKSTRSAWTAARRHAAPSCCKRMQTSSCQSSAISAPWSHSSLVIDVTFDLIGSSCPRFSTGSTFSAATGTSQSVPSSACAHDARPSAILPSSNHLVEQTWLACHHSFCFAQFLPWPPLHPFINASCL